MTGGLIGRADRLSRVDAQETKQTQKPKKSHDSENGQGICKLYNYVTIFYKTCDCEQALVALSLEKVVFPIVLWVCAS
jgi:hypothetical protein